MAESEALPSSGVDALVTRLRDQGIEAGRREAERLVAEARSEAERIVAAARAEAEGLRGEATAAVERERAAGLAAIDLACRDALLRVREEIEHRIAQRLGEIATTAMSDSSRLESLVLDIARYAVAQYEAAPSCRLAVGTALSNDAVDALIGALTREVLTDGIELARVTHATEVIRLTLAGPSLEIDVSPSAVARLVAGHLLPRFRALLQSHSGLAT